ncbi:MAG: PASTA domain-containing protein [Clostridia bacterium]|nr:PASTA domain-containing protein [Clostridia bacterium]
MEKEKLCLRCMRKIGNNTTCPYCRNESNKPQKEPYLPLKTVVGGRYLIGKVVSSNGEGSTYNAFDLQAKKPVTLRELYPNGLLSRGEGNYCLVNVGKASEFIDAKDSFLKMWRKLASLKGFTALTPVTDIFEDLGTVYTVSEFLGDGQTLREYLLGKEQGYISWDEARVLFMPVLSALDELHASGIIHGGISPTNLVIDSHGKLRITGYCIQAMRTEKSGMECELFDGYAAVEQYGMSSGLGTYTDIYAFAAVLYRALIGSTPISAASRLTNDKLMIPGKFAEQLPAYVINSLVNALQILPQDRTETAEQLRDELSASPAAAGTSAEAYSSMYAAHNEEYDDYSDEDESTPPLLDVDDEEEYEDSANKKNTVIAFVVSAVVCLAILIGVLAGFKGCSDKEEETTEISTEEQITEETEEETEVGNVAFKVPDFRGELYDDIKNNEKYKAALKFKTEYVDSKEKRGTVVSQSINAGTEVTSLNPRTITLKISNGLEVPDVVGKSVKDALEQLKSAGFTNVTTESGQVASNASQSGKVYRVVYDNPKADDWAEIPADRHLSSTDTLIVYYYGEIEESTEPTQSQNTTSAPPATQSQTQAPTEAPTQPPVETPDPNEGENNQTPPEGEGGAQGEVVPE